MRQIRSARDRIQTSRIDSDVRKHQVAVFFDPNTKTLHESGRNAYRGIARNIM